MNELRGMNIKWVCMYRTSYIHTNVTKQYHLYGTSVLSAWSGTAPDRRKDSALLVKSSSGQSLGIVCMLHLLIWLLISCFSCVQCLYDSYCVLYLFFVTAQWIWICVRIWIFLPCIVSCSPLGSVLAALYMLIVQIFAPDIETTTRFVHHILDFGVSHSCIIHWIHTHALQRTSLNILCKSVPKILHNSASLPRSNSNRRESYSAVNVSNHVTSWLPLCVFLPAEVTLISVWCTECRRSRCSEVFGKPSMQFTHPRLSTWNSRGTTKVNCSNWKRVSLNCPETTYGGVYFPLMDFVCV